jgi:hypothetical protein
VWKFSTVLAVHFLSILVKDDPRPRKFKHWFKELDDSQAAAFADTPIGQSLLKLDESQRKRLESLFNTAYGVVKAGKPFSNQLKIHCSTNRLALCPAP